MGTLGQEAALFHLKHAGDLAMDGATATGR
jgi:hypothetical protein